MEIKTYILVMGLGLALSTDTYAQVEASSTALPLPQECDDTRRSDPSPKLLTESNIEPQMRAQLESERYGLEVLCLEKMVEQNFFDEAKILWPPFIWGEAPVPTAQGRVFDQFEKILSLPMSEELKLHSAVILAAPIVSVLPNPFTDYVPVILKKVMTRTATCEKSLSLCDAILAFAETIQKVFPEEASRILYDQKETIAREWSEGNLKTIYLYRLDVMIVISEFYLYSTVIPDGSTPRWNGYFPTDGAEERRAQKEVMRERLQRQISALEEFEKTIGENVSLKALVQEVLSMEIPEAGDNWIESSAIRVSGYKSLLEAYELYLDRLDLVDIGPWLNNLGHPDHFERDFLVVSLFSRIEQNLPCREDWLTALEAMHDLAVKLDPKRADAVKLLIEQARLASAEDSIATTMWSMLNMHEYVDGVPYGTVFANGNELSITYRQDLEIALAERYPLFHSWRYQTRKIAVHVLSKSGIENGNCSNPKSNWSQDFEFAKELFVIQCLVRDINPLLFHRQLVYSGSTPHTSPQRLMRIGGDKIPESICGERNRAWNEYAEEFRNYRHMDSVVTGVAVKIVLPTLITVLSAQAGGGAGALAAKALQKPVSAAATWTFEKTIERLIASGMYTEARRQMARRTAELVVAGVVQPAAIFSNLTAFTLTHKALVAGVGFGPFWDPNQSFWGNFGESFVTGAGMILVGLPVSRAIGRYVAANLVNRPLQLGPFVSQVTLKYSEFVADTTLFYNFEFAHLYLKGLRSVPYASSWEEAADALVTSAAVAGAFAVTGFGHHPADPSPADVATVRELAGILERSGTAVMVTTH